MKKNPTTYWIASTLIPERGHIKLFRALERHKTPQAGLSSQTTHSQMNLLLEKAEEIISKVTALGAPPGDGSAAMDVRLTQPHTRWVVPGDNYVSEPF